MIAVFHDVEPREHIALEILHRAVLGFVLDVENRRQVAFLKLHLLEEEVSLVACRRAIAPEMIGTANETVFAGFIEIVVELLVEERGSLGALHNDEAQGASLNHRVTELVPLYRRLVVRDVDAVNLIAVGIAGIAVEGTPAESRRADEEIIEQPDIDHHHADTAYPPSPSGIAMEHGVQVVALMRRLPPARGGSLTVLCLLFLHFRKVKSFEQTRGSAPTLGDSLESYRSPLGG